MRRVGLTAAAIVAVVAGLVLVAVLEGDFPEELTDVRAFARLVVGRFGVGGSLALLYIEESGVPLPVPGDVYVAYLGRAAGGDVLRWVASWLAIIAVVVAGASNLYWISRRWGGRILEFRLIGFLHIDRERLHRAETIFARWGAVAIIFGRHIPGLRVPLTVAAGVSRVSYPVFIGSVAISTAVWAAVWLFLGARFGPSIGHFIGGHVWALAVAVLLILIVLAVGIVREWRRLPTVKPTD